MEPAEDDRAGGDHRAARAAGGDHRAAARAAGREAGRRARASLGTAERDAATTSIVARLAALAEIGTASRVLLTRAVGDELDLRALEEHLRSVGTVVALPVVDGDHLRAVDVVAGSAVRPGWRGVPEPVGPTVVGPIDVVVVPALALDRRGERLGYGGGHFDRFLAGPAATATTVGAVFGVQLVEEVPTAPHDVRLDVVVTEEGEWRDGDRVA